MRKNHSDIFCSTKAAPGVLRDSPWVGNCLAHSPCAPHQALSQHSDLPVSATSLSPCRAVRAQPRWLEGPIQSHKSHIHEPLAVHLAVLHGCTTAQRITEHRELEGTHQDGEIQAKPPEQLRDLGCLRRGCSLVTLPPGLNLTLHLVGSKIPPFTKSQGFWAVSMLDRKTESDSSGEVRHKLRE